MIVATTALRQLLAACWTGAQAPPPLLACGWGSGATPPQPSDATLGQEQPGRQQAQLAAATTGATNDTLVAQAQLTATTAFTLAEAGLFTALAGGALLLRSDALPRPLLPGDSARLTFTLAFGS